MPPAALEAGLDDRSRRDAIIGARCNRQTAAPQHVPELSCSTHDLLRATASILSGKRLDIRLCRALPAMRQRQSTNNSPKPVRGKRDSPQREI
jgi:hypothetical protein